MEPGVGLERQLVVRDMIDTERQRAADIRQRHGHRLAGQPVHQVEIDPAETGPPGRQHRAFRVVGRVDAPEPG